ncbi:electron transfer flavoprotein subunit beta/FixA family protein [Haloferax volcanii]|uniref:Electron transfer flavoprotein beta subunit n=3 Tax=Haloferax volcanii TaxID=2246 RepID=D4GW61_HALVD|nr:electron transfer flavoprotein subunit beta [Haloferax volcanii]ADE03386.1 electron transfer flavoprotein beta subunit [Haloferax volcanii DS2]MBS8118487.1 electron transfer flavoprotein subunit beta/FixA family protein [Haloferax volcanii]MBS8123500.1 electron transfer flavoprotein subunit beta/FixA family protein [Haloferax volcanii]MBS8127368.1 electron transfer flavoprotein subunit beta/FixA family protein [Haloferax volcanii]MBS8131234.1 electron transfer flavoprotein subunit beta/FixA
MHMVVLTKGVPDFREGQVSFDEDGHLERGKTPTVMNPNDRFALEAALQTRVRHGGRVSVMSMGPPGYKEVLQEAMETVYADDLHLVSDREMAAADTWATAITLSGGIETLGEPDVVFAGFKTADGETGHTGPQTNWCLGMPLVTHVVSLDIDEEAGTLRAKRLVEGDIEEIETVETELPAFVVADPEFEPSYRTAGERLTLKDLREETRARAENYEEHLTVRDHADINVDPDYIGLDGSPTIVSSVDPIPKAPAEREATMVDPDDAGAMQDVLTAMQSAVGDGDGDAAAAGGD